MALKPSVKAVLITASAIADCSFFFFFNDTATTEIYTLSLHDASDLGRIVVEMFTAIYRSNRERRPIKFPLDNRSEEHSLNSSHLVISYAVFCLKKKKKKKTNEQHINKHHTDFMVPNRD